MSRPTHPTINKFMEAVYPNNVELAFACFNEISALNDAADEIISLRSRVQELEAENSRLGLALSDKQFEYAANLLAVESDKYGWDQLKARLAEAEGLLKIWMESITGGAEMNWTQDALRKFWKGCGHE